MAHVSRYLNTERGDASTATILSANQNELDWLTGGTDGLLTITVRQGKSVSFRVCGAHLLLFAIDIVILAIDVEPEDLDDAAAWFDLLHYARFFTGDRARSLTLSRPPGKAARKAYAVLGGLLESSGSERPDSGPPRVSVGEPSILELDGLGVLAEVLLKTSSTSGEHLLLPRRAQAQDEASHVRQLNRAGEFLAYSVFLLAAPATDFEKARSLLARAIGSHHWERPITSHDIVGLGQPVLPYSEEQWLYATTEGAGFLSTATSDDKFNRTVLPAHLRNEYFLAYCFVIFQRFALLRLSEEVAERSFNRALPFTSTQRRVLQLTGRGLFVQISHSQHHHAWYTHLQALHQVQPLHQEVREEVAAFLDFQQSQSNNVRERRARATEGLVVALTAILVPMQVVASLFPDRVKDWPYLRALPVSIQAYGALGLSLAVGVLTYVLLRRAKRAPEE